MNSTVSSINSSNGSISCKTNQVFKTFNDFFECYTLVFVDGLDLSIMQVLFCVSTVLANMAVIIRILLTNGNIWTIYEKIFMWLCTFYLVESLIDFPLFHFEDRLGYWPFGDLSANIIAAYEANMSTFISLLVLYMSYVRYRSIVAPVDYLNERLLQWPNLVISMFLLVGISIWAASVAAFHTFAYTTHISYNPNIFQFIINFIVWFLPLLGVYILGGLIIYKLREIQIKKHRIGFQSKKKNLFHAVFDAKSKFTIIIVAFLVQWTVPCLFMLAETFLPVRLDQLILAFKWSTYTVALTDPVLILTFSLTNRNVAHSSQSNSSTNKSRKK